MGVRHSLRAQLRSGQLSVDEALRGGPRPLGFQQTMGPDPSASELQFQQTSGAVEKDSLQDNGNRDAVCPTMNM